MLNRLKIFRDMVSSHTSLIPFVFMLLNIIGFAIAFYAFVCECEMPYIFHFIYDINGQICDVSLIGFILMLGTSKNYRSLSWISFFSLLALWVLNTIYICFHWDADLYYSIASLVIYTIFVILTLRVLTNAKN